MVHLVKGWLHWVAVHLGGCTPKTRGAPALVVAAVAIVVGYKILRRTGRFAVEVALVAAALAAATELGWVRW